MNKEIKYNYNALIKETNINVIYLDNADDLEGYIVLDNERIFKKIDKTTKNKNDINANLESWLYNTMPSKRFKDKMLMKMLIYDIKTKRVNKMPDGLLKLQQTLIFCGYRNINDTHYADYKIFNTNTNKITMLINPIFKPKIILDFSNYYLNYKRNVKQCPDTIAEYNNNFKENFVLNKFIDNEDIKDLKKIIISLLNNKNSNHFDIIKIDVKNQYHLGICKKISSILKINIKVFCNDYNNENDIDEEPIEINTKSWLNKYSIWEEHSKNEEIYNVEFEPYKLINVLNDDGYKAFEYILFCYLMDYDTKNT
jgi:hypothetical protein